MSLGFDLISDLEFWKVDRTFGYNTQRKWEEVEGAPESFLGVDEPFDQGISTIVLPTGASSRDAFTLFTKTEMQVYNDLAGDTSIPTTIYLTDPDTTTNPVPYLVWDEETYRDNSAMQFLGGHHEYVCVRRDKTGA